MSDETMERGRGERPGAGDHTAQTPASCHLPRRLRLHAQKPHFHLKPQPRSLLSCPSWLPTDLHSETNLHPGRQPPHLKASFFCPFSPPLRSLGTEERRVPGGADLGVGQSNAHSCHSTIVSLRGAIQRGCLIQPQSQYQALHFHFALSPTNHVAAVSLEENICIF